MGDRGNIAVIHENKDQIWLYSHWGGYSLPSELQKALVAGKGRWNDESYLTKILFCQVIGDDWKSETGYGISGRMQDREHPVLVVDIGKQRVFVIPYKLCERESNGKIPIAYEPEKDSTWSFDEYCQLEKLPWGENVEA